jgi:hypothetical protein
MITADHRLGGADAIRPRGTRQELRRMGVGPSST